jgi:hypothetical protein
MKVLTCEFDMGTGNEQPCIGLAVVGLLAAGALCTVSEDTYADLEAVMPAGTEFDSSSEDLARQIAALVSRRAGPEPEVLLVTSRTSGHWLLPKGCARRRKIRCGVGATGSLGRNRRGGGTRIPSAAIATGNCSPGELHTVARSTCSRWKRSVCCPIGPSVISAAAHGSL